MTYSKKIAGMNVELRTNEDGHFVGEVFVDDVMVGCEAMSYVACEKLYDELTRDKSGEKARHLKRIMKAA